MHPVEHPKISSAFIWRRVHSLMGFWLVLYLAEHLLVNSQAALWIGEDGSYFVRMVNSLESLPYLPLIELVFIGFPLAIHAAWGIHRALSARMNSKTSNGSIPSLSHERNRAFSWQRITSWILLIGITGHVVQMRFLEAPQKLKMGGKEISVVKITMDEKLAPLASRLGVQLYGPSQTVPSDPPLLPSLKSREVWAAAESPGKVMLLMVRNTFKSSWMAIFYTLFLFAAVFHALNGFWTFLITWGVLLSYRSQKAMIPLSVIGMGLFLFLGCSAIWGSYWLST